MRIAIVGAGIVGVSTAHELAAQGHAVTVFERRGSVAAEASFAAGGLVAPGLIEPSCGPGALPRLLRGHGLLQASPTAALGHAGWLWRWWRSGQPDTRRRNRLRLLRLALFSRAQWRDTAQRLRLDVEQSAGALLLLRDARALAARRDDLKLLAELGLRFHLVDAVRCRELEPGLNPETPVHAGLHFPDAEIANTRQAAVLLRHEAQRAGVEFRFHERVLQLQPGPRPVLQVEAVGPDETRLPGADADSGPRSGSTLQQPADATRRQETFDAVVLCNALGAVPLLAPHHVVLPLAPVHGCSLTAPLRHLATHPDIGPRGAVIDARQRLVIGRLGQRLRVSGLARLGGDDGPPDAGTLAPLYRALHDWFPGCVDLVQAQRWRGRFAVLPDGPPIVGASGLPGVWLNLGQGDHGWALAGGCARLVADALAGRPPAIEVDGLGLERLR